LLIVLCYELQLVSVFYLTAFPQFFEILSAPLGCQLVEVDAGMFRHWPLLYISPFLVSFDGADEEDIDEDGDGRVREEELKWDGG
jgi:hypothetical protein